MIWRRDRVAIATLWMLAAARIAVADDGRGPLYPSSQGLAFKHRLKPHRLACTKCHAGIDRSVSARDRHLPREASCRGCHAKATRASDDPKGRLAGGRRCAKCHRGYLGVGVPARVSYPQARLRFSHRLHQQRSIACGACHGALASLPKMARCLACHRKERISRRCVVCHLSDKAGRLLTRFGAVRLRPRGTLKGDAHTLQFYRKHASVARGNRRYCQRCHRPDECLKCHAGTLRPMSIHRADYASLHGLDARTNKSRCQGCHRSQTFCLSCHQRSGVSQLSVWGGFKPTTGLTFHPVGFNSIRRGPKHHAYAARRNIRTCASCHQEKTCVRCHGTRGAGLGGYSPHPPGFAGSIKCRSLAARNQRSCLKCHRGGDVRIGCR